MNTGELLMYQNNKGNIKIDVRLEIATTPEGSNIYRNDVCVRDSTPAGVVHSRTQLFL